MQVALTIPVNSATCNRHFFSMRRLRYWMTTSLVQQRFIYLSNINIDIANEIVPEEILNTFTTVDRKLCLTH